MSSIFQTHKVTRDVKHRQGNFLSLHRCASCQAFDRLNRSDSPDSRSILDRGNTSHSYITNHKENES
jgi:hypothetical protein